MTLTDFITRYNGKYVDTDGAYGGQCMDLMHQYCVEVLGIQDLSVLAAPSAQAVWNSFSTVKGHELFEKIENTPTGVPQEGDIMFWVNLPYGHVAVFHDGDVNSFKSFDQNYPTGSPCHIQNHTYANVGGWLRFKGSVSLQNQLDAKIKECNRNWDYFAGLCDVMGVAAVFETAKAELVKLVGIEDIYNQTQKQLTDAQVQANVLNGQLKELSESHNTLQTSYNDLQTQLNTDKATIDTLTKNLAELEKAVMAPVRKGWKAFLVGLVDRL